MPDNQPYDMPSFVIIARNKQSSIFYVRPRKDLDREMEMKRAISSTDEGLLQDYEIIGMMGKGIRFYTWMGNIFMDVQVVDGKLSSVNGSGKDILPNLPIIGKL